MPKAPLKDVTPYPLTTRILWVWERATDVAEAAEPGLFTPQAALPLTLLGMVGFSVLLWPVLGAYALLVGFIFARLVALDLTTYTLPNIYTVPLLLVGWAHAASNGRLLAAWLLFLGLMLLGSALAHSRFKAGLGAGDLKLLAALCAFIPLPDAFWATAIGCITWLPVAFVLPKSKIPMGVPLILGWVIWWRFGPQLASSLQHTFTPLFS